MNKNLWQGRKVLLTGHTGFKGSWLAAWLKELGAEVIGVSLDPYYDLNHWDLLQLDIVDYRVDLRDADAIADIVKRHQPDTVFHLASQALVRKSYRDPLLTWSTNVMGAANLLEACRHSDSVQSIVMITSDKCYENVEWEWGYRENDQLGGIDPYSASKSAVELLASSYRRSWLKDHGILLATTRAGNVIGGGDWSEDRLIPDVVRATTANEAIQIRSPKATRPWQHVLECVGGYLCLAEKLIERKADYATAWNFGPDDATNQSVEVMLSTIKQFWPQVKWELTGTIEEQMHECTLLHLDSSKARKQLNWAPVWTLEETLEKVAHWYRAYYETGAVTTKEQLASYQQTAKQKGLLWAQDETATSPDTTALSTSQQVKKPLSEVA